ncbi:aminoglycoside phosphotransferase family protein [Streptomyces sp. NPDC003860]
MHLAPAPVVVRIPVVLPDYVDLDFQARRQRSELDVTRWLADHGCPVIPPSPLVPLEPVLREGFSMTFWQYVEEDRDREPDYVANAESTAALHAALRAYPGELEFLSAAEPRFVTDGLAALDRRSDLIAAGDLDRARREWGVLAPLVSSRAAFHEAFPGVELQPIHGDSPPANVFPGVHGDLHADFELVTLGPVEWGLAGFGPEHHAAYERGARRHGARPLNADVLGFVNAVGMLRAVSCLALAPQLPVLVEYVQPAVEHWRTLPFAGGVPRRR